MKFLTLAVLAGTIFTSNVKAENPFVGTTQIVVAPTVTVPISSACVINGGDDEYGICQASIMLGGTTLVTSAIVLLKEEMQEVQADAHNFLAGEEMTLALAEVITKVREQAPELQSETDEQIVAAIAQIK